MFPLMVIFKKITKNMDLVMQVDWHSTVVSQFMNLIN